MNVRDFGYSPYITIDLSNSTIVVLNDAYEIGETLLTTVEATDSNGENVTLSLPNTTQFQATGFNIEIIGSLQELDNPYELQIVATVDGDSPRSSNATLTLSLQSRPVFTNLGDNDDIYMYETDYGGDVLYNLTATDDDNDDLTFSIISVDPENGETFFDISGDTLIVTDGIQMGTFDVDAINAVTRYTLELRVSDAYFYSTISIFINVEDFNDNQPTFTAQMPAKIFLLESTKPGASIYQVSVTDNDRTEGNRNFSFTFKGSTDFEIDRINGTIYLAASSEPLDYETQPEYLFKVLVNDTDNPDTVYPVAGIVLVTVETAPEITNLAAPVTIKQNESTAEETVVFTLEVQDDDQLPADTVTCIILEESNPGVFELNSYDIVLREALDAETTVSYTLKFRCTDGQYQTESAVLKIAVTDVNDNNPSITVNNGLTFREDAKSKASYL
ncbi:Cadherin-23 [Mactra antiquata]